MLLNHRVVVADLNQLFVEASNRKGWDQNQTRTFIKVGEYDLALDSLAYAFIKDGAVQPPFPYALFVKLATDMELLDDPELQGLKAIIAAQSNAAE